MVNSICAHIVPKREELKKFRFSRSTAGRAIVMKIDASKMMLVIDEHYEDTTTEELR